MLTIEFEIPGYDEESLHEIVQHQDLDKVINSGRENVLNPHLRTEVDIEVLGFVLATKESSFVSSLNVLELRATFDDNVVRKFPYFVHMSSSR